MGHSRKCHKKALQGGLKRTEFTHKHRCGTCTLILISCANLHSVKDKHSTDYKIHVISLETAGTNPLVCW